MDPLEGERLPPRVPRSGQKSPRGRDDSEGKRPIGRTSPRAACFAVPCMFSLDFFGPFLPNISIFSVSTSSSERKAPHALPHWHQIYDTQGHRLSLTGSERAAFRTAAEAAPREVRTYCWTLLYTGCRPSEALALTADRVDFQAAVLTFESKKKRRPGLYRAVPVPATLLDALDLVHGLRDRAPARISGRGA